ncbi:MAG: hypothetical protein ACI8ZX_001268 [Planctomycetota bacterium]|jgi:hypothetical protein
MTNTKKNNPFTKIAISLLIFTFLFYLITAKPVEKFGWNQNNEISQIQEMNKRNLSLNKQATVIPEKFVAIETRTKGIYKYVERMPKFINCEYMLEADGFLCTQKYILQYAQKFELPKDKTLSTDYAVLMKFIVNKKGYVKEVEILNKEPNKLNALAIAHIKKMPKFARPGFQDDKPVKVQYVIRIKLKKTKH